MARRSWRSPTTTLASAPVATAPMTTDSSWIPGLRRAPVPRAARCSGRCCGRVPGRRALGDANVVELIGQGSEHGCGEEQDRHQGCAGLADTRTEVSGQAASPGNTARGRSRQSAGWSPCGGGRRPFFRRAEGQAAGPTPNMPSCTVRSAADTTTDPSPVWAGKGRAHPGPRRGNPVTIGATLPLRATQRFHQPKGAGLEGAQDLTDHGAVVVDEKSRQ